MTREELKTATNDELIDALNYCGYDSYYRDYRDDVVAEIKKRMQDSILDKIRAEIVKYEADCRLSGDEEPCKQCNDNVFGSIYRIIEKYKAGE